MTMVISGTSGVTFPDTSTQTTAGATTAQVLSATAGASAGAVGTYLLADAISGTTTYTLGSTIAGSSLRPTAAGMGEISPGSGWYALMSSGNGSAQSGTWRCMCHSANPNNNTRLAFWLRIS